MKHEFRVVNHNGNVSLRAKTAETALASAAEKSRRDRPYKWTAQSREVSQWQALENEQLHLVAIGKGDGPKGDAA